MRKVFIGLLLWVSSLSLYAQQTIFNVPSSDITPQRKILAQQQIDVNREQFRSMTTVNYGLGQHWEIGLNLYNVMYQDHHWIHNDTTTQIPYAPLLLLNAQKVIEINNHLQAGIGLQTGANLNGSRPASWVGFFYANVEGHFHEDHYQVVAGTYTGNARLLGEGPNVGFHMGFDAGIFYQKFHLLGDWASNAHDYGQLVIGAEVYLTEHLPLAVGWRRSNKDGSQGLVVQLTYTPE